MIDKKIVLYIPVYNCINTIAQVLDEIPGDLLPALSILVVDNCSTDGTAEKVVEWANKQDRKCSVTVVRTRLNLGYSGSQKLAYSMLTMPEFEGVVQKVIMLHGDGQYPPILLNNLVDLFDSKYAISYGYRSKRMHGSKEETPWLVYMLIKTLSVIESFVTGVSSKEWHSGFVMYDISFLKRVRFSELTNTPHIDGHLQFIAGQLNLPVKAVAIYKRYKGYEAFGGADRIVYVLRVLSMMVGFRFAGNLVLQDEAEPRLPFAEHDLIYQSV